MDRAFVCITDKNSDVVGTNELQFVQFSSRSSAMAGKGLVTGAYQELDVNVDDVTLTVIADTVQLRDLGITNAKIAEATVANSKLVHPDVTVNTGRGLLGGQLINLGTGTTLTPDFTVVPDLAASNTFAGPSNTFNNNLAVGGNATVGGTVDVTGATQLQSTLGVTGATTLSNTLAVTGNATLAGPVGVGGTLGVTGATTLSNTLAVTGNATLSGTVGVGGTLDVTGATTCQSTLAVTSGNATTLGGTLGVTGATTLSSTLAVAGNATVGGSLGVDGPTDLLDTLDVTGAVVLQNTLDVDGARTCLIFARVCVCSVVFV
jgi:predicted acyltransferase (DUF342 family)